MSSEFDTFARENYPTVVRTLALATGDSDGAEDAAQEAFTKAAVRWRRVRRMDRPVGWVYVVALNTARRARKRQPTTARPNEVEPAAIGDHASAVSTRVTVHAALAGLPPRQRAAVVLRYLGDLSVADTAAALGVSPGTIKSTTHDALTNLRAVLEGGRHG